jgi:O-acetyl-ADP-ribose deacetylase (regulator of RNase III)|tara:strand:+ start:501 stop:803 length:303 start_codon:yes stop_codon:yes gene_type:complete
MIHEVEGDILLSKAQVIAHGVAANDPMNQGLALALHERYPSMHKDYHHWCHQQHPKPGAAWVWGGAEGVRIISLLTQDGGYGEGYTEKCQSIPQSFEEDS